jgi:hypothetical protein
MDKMHVNYGKVGSPRVAQMTIRRAKGFELMKFVFMTHLNTFGSKVFLILKIMDFENVVLTIYIYIYIYIYDIKGIMYNDINSNCNQNLFIFKMQC